MEASIAHLTSWSEGTKGDVPLPLTGPSLTVSPLPLPFPPTIFLFGGKHVHSRRLTNDIWAMDLVTKVWEKVDAGEGPSPRYFHSMDVWEDKLVCFGGMSESDPLCVHNDVWFFDCRARRWLPQSAPSSGFGPADNVQDINMVPQARYAHLSAVSRGQLIVSGGQHSDNSWIYEINVYDLKQKLWISKTQQPEMQGLHSKGAYRSVATSSKQKVIIPKTGSASYAIDEEGEGGDVWCYSNYDFAKVRREVEVISPLDSPSSPTSSRKYQSPPGFSIRDETDRMHGPSQPPGLRFPTGGIVGNHFILCGLYLASSSAAFSIWALDLTTLAWRHLEPAVLTTGSWNRAVVWPERAKLLVFGNNQYDLASDYGRRAVNLDHVAVVNLETYGIYRPPRLEVPSKVQEVGLSMLDEKLASDFEVICDDGRKIKCSKKVLHERWPWFAEQETELADKTAGLLREAPALDINDSLLGSFTPAHLTPTHLNIPEPFPVCVALVQYFYTLSLSTALQNRAPVLSALLFLSKQYKIERLRDLVVHALHERLEPSIAAGVYEIATLSGEQDLQVRALNMLHSARGSSSSRAHRQGPAASLAGEGSTGSSSSGPAPNSSGPNGGSLPSLPAANAGSHQGPYRQIMARQESIMLPSQEEERDREQINNLLAALSVMSQDTAEETDDSNMYSLDRPVSPLDPELPTVDMQQRPGSDSPSIPPRPKGLRISPLTPPRQSGDSLWPRPRSPSISDASSFPATPGGSVRDFGSIADGITPYTPSSASMDGRSFSGGYFPKNLATLPEVDQVDPKIINRPFTTRSPPTSYKLSQATNSGPLIHSNTLPARFGASSSSLNRDLAPSRSISDISTRSLDMRITSRPSTAPIGAERVWQKNHDTASISSGSTGTSSKNHMTRAERKLVAAAEKASKKAEAQAKFEALRREQMRKLARDKVEAQRLAETAAEIGPLAVPKIPSKSKFGKFGAKLAESVLFPAGGENAMF